MSARAVTAVLIPAHIEQPLETLLLSGFRDIQRLADMVIPVDIEQQQVTMWLDAHDRYKSLPMNLRASSLRWYWDPASRQLPALHGDVLLVGDTGSTIAIGDVPTALIHTLVHGGPYEVETQADAGQPWRVLPDVHESYTDAATWAVIQLERHPPVADVRVRETMRPAA